MIRFREGTVRLCLFIARNSAVVQRFAKYYVEVLRHQIHMRLSSPSISLR